MRLYNQTKYHDDPPPRTNFDVPIVHKITNLYKDVYKLGAKIPKRDKFGINMKIESACLDLLKLSINAALKPKDEKMAVLKELQINIEVTKHLIRTSHELNIIDKEKYISLESMLQEISKMATGWLKYIAAT